MTRHQLLGFMRAGKYAVQASGSRDGVPQAAIVGIVVTDDFEIVFDTLEASRKAANLRKNPSIAFVIGGCDDGTAATLQYQGVTDEPSGAELARLRESVLRAVSGWSRPPACRRRDLVRARPTWMRFSNFAVDPPEIIEIDQGAGSWQLAAGSGAGSKELAASRPQGCTARCRLPAAGCLEPGAAGWCGEALFDLRQRVEDDVADDLQAAGADVIEIVLRRVPRGVVEVDDVDRRDAGAQNGMWSSSIVVSSSRNVARWPSFAAEAQTMSFSHGVEFESRRMVRFRSPIMSSRTSALSPASVPACCAACT